MTRTATSRRPHRWHRPRFVAPSSPGSGRRATRSIMLASCEPDITGLLEERDARRKRASDTSDDILNAVPLLDDPHLILLRKARFTRAAGRRGLPPDVSAQRRAAKDRSPLNTAIWRSGRRCRRKPPSCGSSSPLPRPRRSRPADGSPDKSGARRPPYHRGSDAEATMIGTNRYHGGPSLTKEPRTGGEWKALAPGCRRRDNISAAADLQLPAGHPRRGPQSVG